MATEQEREAAVDAAMAELEQFVATEFAARAIAYCRGQAIAIPTTAAHRHYNEGVAACVRILEDCFPARPAQGASNE